MKKKLLIGTLGAALVFGGAFAVGAAKNDDGRTVEQPKTERTLLSVDEVKNIALKEVDGFIEEIELESKSGNKVYEVEIEKDEVDYDLTIDAYSGEVYTVNHDDDDDDNYRANDVQNKQNIISQGEAAAIAEKTVNGKVIEIERDNDDGVIKYEVELRTDRGEAEVDIDATTGKVLEVEWND